MKVHVGFNSWLFESENSVQIQLTKNITIDEQCDNEKNNIMVACKIKGI